MATILAFAGSNSSTSINLKLVRYTASLLEGHKVQVLNLANYPFPMYSEDYEQKNGFSNSLIELKGDMQNVDGLLISVNEHNGGPSAYFKNLIDWLSRLDKEFMSGKKVFLMSTSPGKRGGIGSHQTVKEIFKHFGAEVIASFSLPSFHENFESEKGILDTDLAQQHKNEIAAFIGKI